MTSTDPVAFAPPPGFSRLAERLEAAGFEAWAVGGCMRDAYARQIGGVAYASASDWDLATSARPEEVTGLFTRTVPVGIEHGTVGVLDDGVLYEVTTFRRDVETDGRHATVTFADTIEEDLGRRDFTVNAIAWRPSTGDVRDPHGGVEDLEAGVLRAVGKPADRFREDFLRVLRGFRFAGRFDLAIEPRTAEALRDAVDGLPALSAERVHEELMKDLADPIPSTALDLYATHGALGHWYPDLARRAADRPGWLATLGAVDAAPRHRPLVRLARLLTHAGEDPEVRGDLAGALLSRLRFSKDERRGVVALVRLYAPFIGPADSSAEHRRWLSTAGDRWRDTFRMHFADARATGSERAAGYLVATWRQVHAERLEHPPLALADLAIGGQEILELGVEPGPLVRLLLDELLEQVLEDPERNERSTLLAESERLIEIGSLAGQVAPRPRSADQDEETDA